jgi:hypothetical protein
VTTKDITFLTTRVRVKEVRRRYTSQPGARGAVSGSCAARRPPHPDEHDQPVPSTGGRDMRSGHGSGPLSYCTRTAVSVQPCLPRELLYTARVLYSYLCLSATMPTTRTPVHHTCTVLLPLCMPTRTLVLRADFNATAITAVATAAVACTVDSGAIQASDMSLSVSLSRPARGSGAQRAWAGCSRGGTASAAAVLRLITETHQ